MALPIVETPRYECTLASQDAKIQYRPFLVKEEKILLVAMESKDNNQIINATKEVIKACTYNEIDVDTESYEEVRSIAMDFSEDLIDPENA